MSCTRIRNRGVLQPILAHYDKGKMWRVSKTSLAGAAGNLEEEFKEPTSRKYMRHVDCSSYVKSQRR